MNKLISDLKINKFNKEIYGNEKLPESFLDSISEKGVMVPLIIKKDDTIISGHRRYKAAKQLDIKEVPVGIASFDNELDEKEAIIDFNRQRDKTFSQKMREAETLEVIERERAKQRQGERTDIKDKHSGKISGKSNGESRDKVAKQVGIGSGRTYDMAKKIWDNAKSGDQQAEKLLGDIDSGEKSISGAYKQVKKKEKRKNVHVSNNSGEQEWYTPPKFLESARKVMGSIDVDPASSLKANESVKADTFHTKETNGLEKKWYGNVWMNPPYSQPLVDEFSQAFYDKWENLEFNQGVILVNNATETKWLQRLLSISDCVCLLKGRVKFIDRQGNPSGAPLQGQVILYFGDNVNDFAYEFSNYGVCLWHGVK